MDVDDRLRTVQRLEVDGVPVLWAQGPAPLSAGLCFGVGRRDEDFASGGITHLVEHLVMRALPKRHLDRNASVSLGRTEFTATGRPEAVREFLEQVCRALSDLPTDDLATEARVLAAEEARSGGDLHGHLLLTRYGATGLGLAGMVEPGLVDLTPAQLQAHAATWFTRERAVLWLTGPPPEGLRLPLPSGPARAPRPLQRRLPLPLPAVLRVPGPDVALSFEAQESGEALLTGLRVLLERLEQDLRHQGGHTYDVDFVLDRVEGDTCHVAFFADAALPAVPQVASGLLAALRRMAQDGPTTEELAHDLEGFREHLADPRSAEAVVGSSAAAHLAGEQPEDARRRLAAMRALTPEQVAAAVATGLESLLLLVPDEADAGVTLPELPEGSHVPPVSGRTSRRRLRSDAPWGARLVSSDDGASVLLGGGTSVTVRYDECVAVGTGPDHPHVELVGVDGTTLPLCAKDWRDGESAVATALRATAGLPRYTIAPDEDGRVCG